MPDIESIIDQFKAADTQVLGVSTDSRFSLENWADSLGGISFPLVADFHPKGAVAASYGLFREDKGITKRSTVIVDKQGIVRYAQLVEPGGIRKAQDLLAECQKVNAG